ncbi:MAG TPA: ABC transporter ATP-binding protein [Candidatus Paceibacterota bacterium]
MFNGIKKIIKEVRILKKAYYKHKNKVIMMTVLGFGSGLVGGIGIGAIVPLFSFVIKEHPEEADPISKMIAGLFSFVGIEYRLRYLIIFIALLFLFKAVFNFLANYLNYRAAVDYEREARQEIFEHAMRADWPHLLKQKVGHLSTVVMENINSASALLNNISLMILFLTSLIMYAIVALNIALDVTLLTFVLGFLLFVCLKPLFKKIRKLSHEGVIISREANHYINQHIIGAKTIKAMAVEKDVIKKSKSHFSELGAARLQIYKYNSVLGTFLEPITLLVIIPIFALSYHSPDFNIASFAAILYLVQKMFSFMQSAQIRLSLINEGMPHLISVLDYQDESRQYKERDMGGLPFSFKSTLSLEGLVFAYGSNKPVLDGVGFDIQNGQTVGLIGPSGSGKTTLVDLILRLLVPAAGHIYVDGEDISKIDLADWRKHIGYVSQDIFLLNDTIENNIRFYNSKITDHQIGEAAKRAQIYDFIMEQPGKFKAEVGERGLQLSVGQRQRIVLARVLAAQPEILILDEATSALDNESEAAIQDAIAGLRGRMTIIIIAHRLTTVTNTDNIFVLGEGRVVESGEPSKLLEDKKSYFYRLYNI